MRYEGSSSIVDVQSLQTSYPAHSTRVNESLGYGGIPPRIGHGGSAILNRVFLQDGPKPCTMHV